MTNLLGLCQLAELDKVIIAQKSTFVSGNKYVVTTLQGDVILYAKENMSVMGAMLHGSNRQFKIDICNTCHESVIKLRRPYTFGPDKMVVTVGGVEACVVRQKQTLLKPVLYINDAHDSPVLRVKGPVSVSGEADFELQMAQDKRPIGVIRKTWAGLLRELFTESDQFQVTFPKDLDVRYKAAVVGTALLIDFLYYEA